MEFQSIYDELSKLLKEYEDHLDVKHNTSDNYYLDTRKIYERNKKPIFFGAVQIKKNYVSFHLMPVYVYPELLDNLSEGLKKRMQGKSCFNFKKYDDELFNELKLLTKQGYEKYKENNMI